MDVSNTISIVVPVYNEKHFLRRCIDSLIAQTHRAQIILVNDGSTDGSENMCEDCKKLGFEVYHIKNSGVSHARNFGMDKAKGEYIAFLDSDDYYEPDAVQKMWLATKHFENYYQFNHYRQRWGQDPTLFQTGANGIWTPSRRPTLHCMVWNKMYRLDFLRENNIRFWEGIDYGEDEIFNLECIFHGQRLKHVCTAFMVKCSDNHESISHQISQAQIVNQYRCLKRLADKYPDFRKEVLALRKSHSESATYQRVLHHDLTILHKEP